MAREFWERHLEAFWHGRNRGPSRLRALGVTGRMFLRAFAWYAVIPYLLAVVLTRVRGRRVTAITFTFAGGAISVVQQGPFQRS